MIFFEKVWTLIFSDVILGYSCKKELNIYLLLILFQVKGFWDITGKLNYTYSLQYWQYKQKDQG